MRCLIVDDDLKHVAHLKRALVNETFAVDTALDGEAGSFLARVHPYDIVIIDHLVKKKSGQQICLELRNARKDVPVLALIRTTDISDRLDMFAAGADDCLLKPYAVSELLARMRAILRRGPSLKEQIFQIGKLLLNATTQQVFMGRKLILLSARQYAILEILVRNRGRIVSKETLIERVWDKNADPFSRAIETHIWSLRSRLKDHKLIRTVLGRGYVID